MERPPPKRTRGKSQNEELENRIAVIAGKVENIQALLSKSLAAEPPNNPKFRDLERWTLAVRLELDDFEPGNGISEPPYISHEQYGPCYHPSPLQLT